MTIASGRGEVFIQPTPRDVGGANMTAKLQVSQAGGSDPRWRTDGKELFFVTATGDVMRVPIESGEGYLRPGPAAKLFSREREATAFIADPNGQRFLMNLPVGDAPQTPITVLVNWMQLLPRE